MSLLLARTFRFLFKFRIFHPLFFGVHKHIFKKFHLFQGVVQTVNFNGFQLTLHLDDWIQENIYFLRAYEKAELKLVSNLLKRGDVFLDLGANLGLYSLHASREVGKNGKVISFEPFSINFKALNQHISINQLTNVYTEQKAVGETSGTITLYHNKEEENLGMVTAIPIKNAREEKVEMISIDAYLKEKQLQEINFIKIDIEGFEYPTLLGMEKTLKLNLPYVLIEILHDSQSPQNQFLVEDYLMGFGYKKYFITDVGTLSKSEVNPLRRNYLYSVNELDHITD